MKLKRLVLSLAVASAALTAASCAPTLLKSEPGSVFREEPGFRTVAIFGMNDFHGSFEERTFKTPDASETEYRQGGIAILSSYLSILKKEYGPRLLVLDAGDEWQGSIDSNLDQGESAVKFFNRLGVQGATLGNHEFDFGSATLERRLREARYPYLSANVFRRKPYKPVAWDNLYPSRLYEADGVKIGVIGFSTVDTATTTEYENVRDLVFVPQAAIARKEAAKLRASGARAVVLLMHAGAECESGATPESRLERWKVRGPNTPQGACNPGSEVQRILKALPPGTVDLVIAGHTHQILHHWIEGVPVMQGGAFNRYFNLATLKFDRGTGKLDPSLTRIEGPVPVCRRVFENLGHCDGKLPLPPGVASRGDLAAFEFHGTRVVPDADVERELESLFRENRKIKSQVVGYAARAVKHVLHEESEFGNWVADILRERTRSDFAVINAEGIRSGLEAGAVTFDDAYRALPFDNKISVVQMTGAEIRHMLQIMTSGVHGVASVSGLRLLLASSDAPDSASIEPWQVDRLREIKTAQGDDLDPKKLYRVATYDYIVRGGDHQNIVFDRIPESRKTYNAAGPTRETVIYYLKDAGKINSEERPLIDPKRPRIRFTTK